MWRRVCAHSTLYISFVKFSRISGLLGCSVLAGILVIACAAGGDGDGTDGADADTGGSTTGGSTTGGTAPTSTGTSTPAPPTGTSDASTTADGGPDSGAGDGGSGDGGSTTNPGACSQTGACPASVVDIGAVSGDKNADVVTKVGSGSGFFRIRVTENDATLLSRKPVNSRYTLTSPAGANYDLVFSYDASDNDIAHTNCTHTGETTGTQQIKVQSLSWPDSQGIGGHDDSSNVTVEVRFTSGTCNAGDQWQLVIEGNKQ